MKASKGPKKNADQAQEPPSEPAPAPFQPFQLPDLSKAGQPPQQPLSKLQVPDSGTQQATSTVEVREDTQMGMPDGQADISHDEKKVAQEHDQQQVTQ